MLKGKYKMIANEISTPNIQKWDSKQIQSHLIYIFLLFSDLKLQSNLGQSPVHSSSFLGHLGSTLIKQRNPGPNAPKVKDDSPKRNSCLGLDIPENCKQTAVENEKSKSPQWDFGFIFRLTNFAMHYQASQLKKITLNQR